jgi:hypothetical protein
LDNPNNYPQFDGYIADDLIANGTWQYIGFDSYQSGTVADPGDNSLASRYNTIVQRVATHGPLASTLPFVIGEYNTNENTTAQAVSNVILNNDRIAIACVFNSNVGSKGIVLSGSMLTTYKNLKANAKFKQ